MERKIKELNETNRKRDTRKFYKDVRNLSNLRNVTTFVCKDERQHTIQGVPRVKVTTSGECSLC